MAKLIKTTQSYYSQIESGAKKPGFNIVKRLSKVIGVSEEFIKSLLWVNLKYINIITIFI